MDELANEIQDFLDEDYDEVYLGDAPDDDSA